TPSWGGHLVLGSASIEHFWGQNPSRRGGDPGGAVGWGCNSGKSTQWFVSGNTGRTINIPSCVPDRNGSMGPTWDHYFGTRAAYVPTIFDSMDQAGVSWRIYYKPSAQNDEAIGWSICPDFWECAGSSQAQNAVDNKTFFQDAANGLPDVSFVIPAVGQ